MERFADKSGSGTSNAKIANGCKAKPAKALFGEALVRRLENMTADVDMLTLQGTLSNRW